MVLRSTTPRVPPMCRGWPSACVPVTVNPTLLRPLVPRVEDAPLVAHGCTAVLELVVAELVAQFSVLRAQAAGRIHLWVAGMGKGSEQPRRQASRNAANNH